MRSKVAIQRNRRYEKAERVAERGFVVFFSVWRFWFQCGLLENVSLEFVAQRSFHKTADQQPNGFPRAFQVAERKWHDPYRPIAVFRSGHAQTLLGNYWYRPRLELTPLAEPVVVDRNDGSRVLCRCHWQREAATGNVCSDRLTLLLVHGLEGSSNSGYIRGITALAWAAGCNVIRMNMRNCGGTEAWTPTLYHSGLSGDVGAVLEHFADHYQLTRMAMVGYSMGGNLVLKLAGELGSAAPCWLRGAAAVSPVTDLAESADALHEMGNRLYERHFLRRLMRRFRRKAQLFPEIYLADAVMRIGSIREFDDHITARYNGFQDAEDYYFRASSARVVGEIRLPTLLIHALDDPFIRMRSDTRSLLASNGAVELVESCKGGHCAFLASQSGGGRHWAEATVVRYLMAHAGHALRSDAGDAFNGS